MFDLNDSPGLVRSDAASPLAILDSFPWTIRALKRIQKRQCVSDAASPLAILDSFPWAVRALKRIQKRQCVSQLLHVSTFIHNRSRPYEEPHRGDTELMNKLDVDFRECI